MMYMVKKKTSRIRVTNKSTYKRIKGGEGGGKEVLMR